MSEETRGKGSSGELPCPPEEIIYDPQHGVRICRTTGEVIEEAVIGDEAEWRAYTPEERARRTRVGSPLSFSRPNLGVDVQVRSPRGGRVRGLPRRAEIIRRAIRTKSVQSSVEKNINQALRVLDDLVSQLELPAYVREEAAYIYRQAVSKGLTRGRSIEGMVAATLYAACRKREVPCTIDEIVEKLRSGSTAEAKREVARNYRMIVRYLELRIPVIKPEKFVERIARALNLPEQVMAEAKKIVMIAKEEGLTAGKDPSGLAAAAVYLAALMHGHRKTQKEVAQVAGVTEVTVRNRYKEIEKKLRERGINIAV